MPPFNSLQLGSKDTNMAIPKQGTGEIKRLNPKCMTFFFPANFGFFGNINEIIKLWDTN